jgi:hypothetical protein
LAVAVPVVSQAQQMELRVAIHLSQYLLLLAVVVVVDYSVSDYQEALVVVGLLVTVQPFF